MVQRHYRKTVNWIERNRFQLLLMATILTLALPAFFGKGIPSQIIFVITLSFLFIQSMVVAEVRKSRRRLVRFIVLVMISVSWLKPLGFELPYIEIVKFSFFVIFFLFVMSALIRFISKSRSVDVNVLIASVNIYLLAGIVGASLAFVFYRIYPDAYNIPAYMDPIIFVHFLYYSFVTMSTVGYGDITPRIPETMTLAYLIAIIGQLYVAIIIAFLIGKFLMQGDHKKKEADMGTDE